MKRKANLKDRVHLSILAPKGLRERYGTKVGVVVNIESIGDSYMSKGYSKYRNRYIVHFTNGRGHNEALWSYEFIVLK